MHVFGISARSVQGQIQGGAKIGQEGPPSSKNFFRLQSANRMHSDDLKASEKKYCSFWLLLLLVFKSVICVCIGTLLNRKFYWSCRILIKKILQDLLMILLCPVQGPWASSFLLCCRRGHTVVFHKHTLIFFSFYPLLFLMPTIYLWLPPRHEVDNSYTDPYWLLEFIFNFDTHININPCLYLNVFHRNLLN